MTQFAVRLFAILAVATSLSVAAQDPARFAIREDLRSAKAIPDAVAQSTAIPFNKRYDELTPKEKMLLQSLYENIGPKDEPPFPAEGIGAIVKPLIRAQEKLLVSGPLYLIVDVSPEGEGTSVAAIGSPSPEMTRVAAAIMLLTKFKPALCEGVPCKQKYPFHIVFNVQ